MIFSVLEHLKMFLFYYFVISLIIILITKPIAPIIRRPIAVTFDINLNSCIVGFLNNLHTRRYLLYCDETHARTFPMINKQKQGF